MGGASSRKLLSMKKLVIFGAGDLAELAAHYFAQSGRPVAAFTVDAASRSTPEFRGLPVISFGELAREFPPATHDLFVAIGYSGVNRFRREKCAAARALGYSLATCVSACASVSGAARLGDNCLVLEKAVVQPFASVGVGVILWSGSIVGHHSVVGDFCFLGPGAAISGRVEVGAGCFIGINATVRDHVRLGPGCVVGCGAVIAADVDAGLVMPGVKATPSARRSDELGSI